MPHKSLCVLTLYLCALAGPALARQESGRQDLPPDSQKSPEELIAAWRAGDRESRTKIYETLLRRHSRSLPALSEAVATGSYEEKILAFQVLTDTRDAGAVPILAEVIATHPSELVRVRAVIVLGEIGAPPALPVVRELLRQGSSPLLTQAALASLGKLGNREDLRLVRKWLRHPDEPIRLQAAAALARLGSSEGEQVILEGTTSGEPLVRKWATEALGLLDTAAARARAEEILRDPDGRWKSYAWVALFQQQANRMAAGEKLKFLEKLASHPNRLVWEWAIQELARFGGENSIPSLQRLSQGGSPQARRAGQLLSIQEER